MPTTSENQVAHPERFVNPDTLAPEVLQFLRWQGEQPNPVGPGTIADAWEQGGTGPFYVAHVATARAVIARYNESGDEKPWLKPVAAPHDDRAQAAGAVFGGS